MRPSPTLALAAAFAAAAAPNARAQDELLTLDKIYGTDAEVRIDFSGSYPRGLKWLDAGHYLQSNESEKRLDRVEAATGKSKPLYDREKLTKALAELTGLDDEDLGRWTRPSSFEYSATHGTALWNRANDLFLYDFEADRAVRLTHDAAPEVGEELSPDGRFVSFVRDHNLHLVEVATGRERALTADGDEELFYGRLDWVYQEEVYGRGNFKGYWWSPDSSRIAFLKLDESPVREFTVVDHLPKRLATEVTNYPKAGDPNPRVWIGVVPAVGGSICWLDTARYEPIEHLIVDVDWTPDSQHVVFQVQDREQTWLDLNLGKPTSGDVEALFRETSPAFVQRFGSPHWLDDGSFLWTSERTGFQHWYHYGIDGELRAGVTSGEWEARTLHGVDEKNGWVYFSGTEHTPIAQHVYRVKLDGTDLERLSEREGNHSASFAPDFAHYLDTWSNFTTPPQVRLHSADGREKRVVAANEVEELARFRLGTVEFLRVPTRDGFEMEACLVKPPGFSADHRYPVLQYNYGGPHAPVVADRWIGSRNMWHHMLAQKGIVIWMCDNRSASGKGIAPTWEAYGRMGAAELADMEDGVAWLRQQSWVDSERIGLWGWSYGGFMAAYALTHSKSWSLAIAGAPVTDWNLYDTIYTERYMRMPQNNPEGYAETSVIEAAADLHGKLLLIHGTMDDNVHLQNSIRFIHALQKAGKQFDLMLYPRSRHGVGDPDLRLHLQQTMTSFLLEEL